MTVLSEKALHELRNKVKQHEDFYTPNGLLRSDLDPSYIKVVRITSRKYSLDDFLPKLPK